MTVAIRRGTTRYLYGLVESVLERIDLLGDPHGAELGRHRGAHPAGHHEGRQTGPSSRVSDTTTMLGMADSAEKRAKPV